MAAPEKIIKGGIFLIMIKATHSVVTFMLVSVEQPAVWEQFELLKYKRRHFINVSLHVFLFLPPWPCALDGSDLGLCEEL